MSWCSRRAALIVIALAAMASADCGYALAGKGNFLPDYIRTIGIPPFTNRTSFFEVSQILTDKVTAEFIGRGNYKIVPDANNVDAVLNGVITGISVIPTGFSAQQQASRYLVTMTASIELREAQKNTVLWSNPAVMFREEWDATATLGNDPNAPVDPTGFFNQEANALQRISSEFARTIVSSILEAF